ncbi:MAG: hypothetical protein NC388_05875 [Clostridium sp.]|nr:hypothetical protein [Clostridium sp.]
MRKRILVLSGLCALGSWTLPAVAQTDVTETYVNNSSFEADAAACVQDASSVVNNGSDGLRGWNVSPQGWTVTSPGVSLLIDADCFTDNNFGKTAAAHGRMAYYQRYGWGSASSVMSQTLNGELPAGEYVLTFRAKGFAANGAVTSAFVKVTDAQGTVLGSTSFTCAAGAADCMAGSEWGTYTVKFSVAESQTVGLTSEMTWGNGGSCIAYDDFRLTQYPVGYVMPDISGGREDEVESPTEGVINHQFVSEADMKQDLLQMLANSTRYAANIWYNCASPNSKNEACGFFKANSAGNSNEDGVRTNADFSMICAFLYKYAQGSVTLPEGITWADVKDMAVKALVFGYSTHKANKFKITSNNAYWGSVSSSDYVWESSLWAMSLAYSSYFLSDELSDEQKGYIYNMIKAECNYELERSVPTGYAGDTKAEENGWEADILACALGLYPDDALAPRWFDRLREFAVNSYSQADDATDDTVIDEHYDGKTVKDLYKGKNLYDDYTLQNHNYFHTSYQNVVMQELGEAQLALMLFQGEKTKWTTRALMHGNREVMDEVLCWLALADGELAMPNGNDWSMFLYDQITSYATAACFLRDPNALMLENMAYKYIKARQTTTPDGSWLLNSDIGPRRMGVEGHRVMMTWLMHEAASTADLQPTAWDDFSHRYEAARLFTSQNIVRSNTRDRFTVFSWSTGLGSYTGYLAANNPDRNKIIAPYKANNTGNILGWYTVSGKGTNATPEVSGVYNLRGNSYTMNGSLLTNDKTLRNSFALYATPGNAFIYVDRVSGCASGTITRQQGGLMAISTDPFTKEQRTLYYKNGRKQTNGTDFTEMETPWVNIDNSVGIVVPASGNRMAFGDRGLSNSIYMAKIYSSYSAQSRAFRKDEVVDRRHIIYYSNVDSLATATLSALAMPLSDRVAEGWNGVIAADPDSARYLLLARFAGESACTLKGIALPDGAPVFSVPTQITSKGAEATFDCDMNHSVGDVLRVFVRAEGLTAWQAEEDSCSAYLHNAADAQRTAQVVIWADGRKHMAEVVVEAGTTLRVGPADDGTLQTKPVEPAGNEDEYVDITARYLANTGFEEDETYGTESSVTLGGITYNPCYVNNVEPVDSRWKQILPVVGWQPESTLAGASNNYNYAVRYSMPYSDTRYCVSPSSVGNSASIMSAPARYADCGERCLSLLNSWNEGVNRVSQLCSLPEGDYKLTFLMNYVCPNEMRKQAGCISTTGNECYSLCGVAYAGNARYVYPSVAQSWEQMEIPFTLDATTDVTVSLGLRSTAQVGAANNARVYLDNVRLWRKGGEPANGIASIGGTADGECVDVCTLSGITLRRRVPAATATSGLPRGIYVVGHRKVAVD